MCVCVCLYKTDGPRQHLYVPDQAISVLFYGLMRKELCHQSYGKQFLSMEIIDDEGSTLECKVVYNELEDMNLFAGEFMTQFERNDFIEG